MVLGGHTEDLRRWPGLLFDHTPAGRALMVATVVLVTPPRTSRAPPGPPGEETEPQEPPYPLWALTLEA